MLLALVICLPAPAETIPGYVVAWGITNALTVNLPPDTSSSSQVSAGGFHAAALLTDRTVVVWGDNTSGQTNVPGTATNIVAISAGAKHTLALRSNGTVVAWGFNLNGQTNVPANLNGVVAVAAGSDHSMALRTNGNLVVWGGSSFGLTNIPVGTINVVAIAAGATATLALRSNGSVVAWGTLASQTNTPPSLTNVAAIAVGVNHCLALRSNGTVLAWGENNFGQTNVPSTLNGVIGVSAGWYHSLALRSNGTVVAWGLGASGQTNVPAGLTNITQLSAGNSFNLALNPMPVIQTKPPAVATLATGDSTTLAISVLSGSSYDIQWFLNGAALPGATNLDLAVNLFDFSKAGKYSVFVTNLFSSTSASSILRLTNAPVVFVGGTEIGGGPLTRTNSAVVTIASTSGLFTNVYYTLDGGAPSFTGFRYTGAFTVSNSVTIRAIAYNSLFSASAESPTIALQVIPLYPLQLTAPGNGAIVLPSPNVGTNLYLSNTIVTITATPSNGWTFLNWSGDSTSTSAVIQVMMDQPRTLKAVFGTTLNLLAVGDGFLVQDPPAGLYPYGTTVTLTALPFPGNYFFGWAGVIAGAGNPATFSATNAFGITALFGPLENDQVSLVAQPVGGGSVAVSPAKNVYTNGEPVMIAAIGTSNRIFAAWSGDATGSTNPLQIILDGSKLIYANFVPGIPTNPPVFTQLPASYSLNRGQGAVLTAAVTGNGPLYYQWRRNGVPLIEATNATLILSNVLPAQAGLYDILVSGGSGVAISPASPVALFGIQTATSLTQQMPLLSVDCAPGARFRLEYTGDLWFTNWTLLTPVTMNSPQYWFVDVPFTNAPQRLYRLVPQ